MYRIVINHFFFLLPFYLNYNITTLAGWLAFCMHLTTTTNLHTFKGHISLAAALPLWTFFPPNASAQTKKTVRTHVVVALLHICLSTFSLQIWLAATTNLYRRISNNNNSTSRATIMILASGAPQHWWVRWVRRSPCVGHTLKQMDILHRTCR